MILAEGVKTRTRRWNPTFHLMLPDGRVVHRLKYVGPDDPDSSAREAEMEIYQFVELRHAEFWGELDRFFEDIRRQALPLEGST